MCRKAAIYQRSPLEFYISYRKITAYQPLTQIILENMNEEELHKLLREHNLSLSDACEMIYNMVNVYIQQRHINTRFDKYRFLSATQTIIFELFFKVLKNGKI